MKKILLVGNHGQGFYNFKKELVEELMSCGYEVHFAVPFYEKLDILINEGAIYHEITVDRRGINPIADFGLIRQLNRVFSIAKPDIIVLHTIKPNIYGSYLAKLKGIPYINNITGLGSALQSESKLAKLLRIMYRVSLNKSAGIFFENKGNRDYFSGYKIGREDAYNVVNGAGVNTKHYTCKNRTISGNIDEEETKKEAAAKTYTDKVNFLMIARIMREKGIVEFLDGAEHITKKYSNAKFQLVGFYDEEDLKERVDELQSQGVVLYLGASMDTRVQMAEADCIVLPSYHEGMSNVLLEGAASGLPLITTNINGCKEAVEDGVTGFLCEPRNSKSLIAAMEKFLGLTCDERLEMGHKGRAKMIGEFDRKIVVDKYVDVIDKIFCERKLYEEASQKII